MSTKIVSYAFIFSRNSVSFTHFSGSNRLFESAPLLKYATSISAVTDFPNRRALLLQTNFSVISFLISLLISLDLSTKYCVLENSAKFLFPMFRKRPIASSPLLPVILAVSLFDRQYNFIITDHIKGVKP